MATVTVTMDGKHYGTHAEVLNRFFGWKGKLYLGAEFCVDRDYSVWFPIITPPALANENNLVPNTSHMPNTSHNGWKNILNNSRTEIRQYWPEPSMAHQQLTDAKKRITFAKFIIEHKYWYEFIGVFEKDVSQSAMDHTFYKRIATQYS